MKDEEGDRHGGCSHSLKKEALTTMVGHSCTEREREEGEGGDIIHKAQEVNTK